jgi:transcriptional repressor NrdR
MQTIGQIADRIETLVAESGDKEVVSSFIGSAVMNELHRIDQVAYVRFASVYRSFKDIEEFMRELEDLIERRKRETGEGSRADENARARDKKGPPA